VRASDQLATNLVRQSLGVWRTLLVKWLSSDAGGNVRNVHGPEA